jgi:hypothetical protein
MDNSKLDLMALEDFKVFLKITWKHLRLPEPSVLQYHMADFLQEGYPRSVLQALRGAGKTWVTGAYAAWRLLRDPEEKILIVSQSGGHSDNIGIFIRKLIETMPILQHLKPDMSKGHRTSNTSFDVNGCNVAVQPSLRTLGITSQLQGNRATLLISDDVEGQNNSATEMRREQLRQQTAEFEAVLSTTDNAQILVLGTPQSAQSIYNGFREDGYVTRIFPARYPEEITIYEGCLAPYIVEAMAKDPSIIGTPTEPRFTEEDLIMRENRYGRSGFKLQFMLDTTLSDAEKYPLKQKDLIVTDLDSFEGPASITWSSEASKEISEIPNVGFRGDKLHRPGTISDDLKKYEGVVLAIDPAGTGTDEMGWVVIAHLLGRLYVLDFGGIRGGYNERNLMELSKIAKRYKVNDVYVEANFGDGMFSSLLAPILNSIYPCNIEEVKVSIQKEVRIIDTLEPIMNQHRLVFNYSSVATDITTALKDPNNMMYSLMFQLSHITRDRQSLRHDDRLDVLALGVSYWLERDVLEQNLDKALDKYRERQLDKQLKEFTKGFKNNPLYNRNGSSKTSKTLRGLKAFS